MSYQKKDKKMMSNEKEDTKNNLDPGVYKNNIRNSFSYEDNHDDDSKMDLVKASEDANEKDNPKKIAKIRFYNRNFIEFGYDKKGLVLGFGTEPKARAQKSVFENKAPKIRLANQNMVESNFRDFKNSAEAMRTSEQENAVKLLRYTRESAQIPNDNSKMSEVMPHLKKDRESQNIEELYKTRDKLEDKQEIQDKINTEKDILILKNQRKIDLEAKFRNALSDFKRYKKSDDFYILYIKKKWQELLEKDASEENAYKISSKDDVNQDVKNAIIFLLSSYGSSTEIKSNLKKIMDVELDENIVLEIINDFYNKEQEEISQLGTDCSELFIKKFSILVDDQYQNTYIYWGNFVDEDDNIEGPKLLGVLKSEENYNTDCDNILKDLKTKGVESIEYIFCDEEMILEIENNQYFSTVKAYVNILDICKEVLSQIEQNVTKCIEDISSCRESENYSDFEDQWSGTWISDVLDVDILIYDSSIDVESEDEVLIQSVKKLEKDILLYCNGGKNEEIFEKWTYKNLIDDEKILYVQQNLYDVTDISNQKVNLSYMKKLLMYIEKIKIISEQENMIESVILAIFANINKEI